MLGKIVIVADTLQEAREHLATIEGVAAAGYRMGMGDSHRVEAEKLPPLTNPNRPTCGCNCHREPPPQPSWERMATESYEEYLARIEQYLRD